MSNPSWSNVPNPFTLAVFNGIMYAAGGYGSSYISKINISDGSIVSPNPWANISRNPNGLVIDSTGTYIYVTNNDNRISKINMSDGSINTLNWTTGLNNPFDLVIDNTGTYMYVVIFGDNRISKINMSDGSIVNANWATLPSSFGPLGLVIDSTGTYMYAANYNGTITKINMSNGTIVNASWATTGVPNQYLTIDSTGTYMYVTNWDYASLGTITQIQMSDGSIVNASYVTGLDGPLGIIINNNFIYVANNNNGNIGKYALPPPPPCFKEGSKILTDTGYKPIETLRKGDLVKTLKHGYKPIDMIGKRDIYNPVQKERIKDQLYKCSQDKYPEVFEDLIITGCHSILVDRFTSNEQKEKAIEVNNGKLCITDNKYRLPACVDDRTSVYENKGNFTIYHIALENDDYYMNYGVYANGLLVETCSKRYLKELSNMVLF